MNNLIQAACQFCGASFESAHKAKRFCSTACQTSWGNFCASLGKLLMPIAIAWRQGRGVKGQSKEALREMCRFLDQCCKELRDAGAGNPSAMYASARKGGYTPHVDFAKARPQRARMVKGGK